MVLTELYYFTGTGNTLFLAKEMAKRLTANNEGTVKIISIASLDLSVRCRSSAKKIGIFFPVYFVDLPDIVKRFISLLDASEASYIFSVDNCGEYDWGVLASARKCFARNKLVLSASFRFQLPDNSIAFPTDPAKYESLFAVSRDQLDLAAAQIRQSASVFQSKTSFASSLVTLLMRAICFHFLGFRDMQLDAEKCTGCATCVKICPVQNISLREGRPVWESEKKCTSCFACIHYCQAKAITFRSQKADRDFQYRNPFVSVTELMRKK